MSNKIEILEDSTHTLKTQKNRLNEKTELLENDRIKNASDKAQMIQSFKETAEIQVVKTKALLDLVTTIKDK